MEAHQAHLSLRFSRQEYWSELPCPALGDLPDLGIEPVSLTSSAVAGGFFTISGTQFSISFHPGVSERTLTSLIASQNHSLIPSGKKPHPSVSSHTAFLKEKSPYVWKSKERCIKKDGFKKSDKYILILNGFYGTELFVLPQIHKIHVCWNLNSRCDSIWRWGFGKVIRSWGWSPCEWD